MLLDYIRSLEITLAELPKGNIYIEINNSRVEAAARDNIHLALGWADPPRTKWSILSRVWSLQRWILIKTVPSLPFSFHTFFLPYLFPSLPISFPPYHLPYLPPSLPISFSTYLLPYLFTSLLISFPTYLLPYLHKKKQVKFIVIHCTNLITPIKKLLVLSFELYLNFFKLYFSDIWSCHILHVTIIFEWWAMDNWVGGALLFYISCCPPYKKDGKKSKKHKV